MVERLHHNWKVAGSSPGAESYQILQKWYSLPSRLALDVLEWSGEVKHAELAVD